MKKLSILYIILYFLKLLLLKQDVFFTDIYAIIFRIIIIIFIVKMTIEEVKK